MINVYPLPVEITDVMDSFFPSVYSQIDKDKVMEYMPSTLIGLAEHYLLGDRVSQSEIKLVPIHFKWMGLFYTLNEMDRLFLSIQLCETVRRYRGEFKLILEEMESHNALKLYMSDDYNHICIQGD